MHWRLFVWSLSFKRENCTHCHSLINYLHFSSLLLRYCLTDSTTISPLQCVSCYWQRSRFKGKHCSYPWCRAPEAHLKLFFHYINELPAWLSSKETSGGIELYYNAELGRKSDDASAQVFGVWAIYDDAVTPVLLIDHPSWEETCFYCIHSSLWHFWWLFWFLSEGHKRRPKLWSPCKVFFYGNSLQWNLKGLCVNWVTHSEYHDFLYYIISSSNTE